MTQELLFNLNFDDFHPSVDPDFGGDPRSGTFLCMAELLDEFPGLVITLFTTPNWLDRPFCAPRAWYFLKERLGFPVIRPLEGEPYRIDKHPSWCKAVREEVARGRVEIAVHGYTHCDPRRYAHGQEFAGLGEEEAVARIKKAEELFERCGIPFVRGFRPPGWGLSAGLLRALIQLRYEFISPFPSRLRVSRPGWLEGLAVLPQNYSISERPEVALEMASRHGVVFAKGHIVHRYGRQVMENGITPSTWKNLRTVLSELNARYRVRYIRLGELKHAGFPEAEVGDGTRPGSEG